MPLNKETVVMNGFKSIPQKPCYNVGLRDKARKHFVVQQIRSVEFDKVHPIILVSDRPNTLPKGLLGRSRNNLKA